MLNAKIGPMGVPKWVPKTIPKKGSKKDPKKGPKMGPKMGTFWVPKKGSKNGSKNDPFWGSKMGSKNGLFSTFFGFRIGGVGGGGYPKKGSKIGVFFPIGSPIYLTPRPYCVFSKYIIVLYPQSRDFSILDPPSKIGRFLDPKKGPQKGGQK